MFYVQRPQNEAARKMEGLVRLGGLGCTSAVKLMSHVIVIARVSLLSSYFLRQSAA